MADRAAAARKELEGLKKKLAAAVAKKTVGAFGALAGQGVKPHMFASPVTKRSTLDGHNAKVYALCWARNKSFGAGSPGGFSPQLISASQDGTLVLWNGLTGMKIQAVKLKSSWVMTCAFEPQQGKMVASGGLDNVVSVFTLTGPMQQPICNELIGHDGYISCCRFIGPSEIVSASGDSTCILWDIESSTPLTSYSSHAGDVMSVSVHPTDPHIFLSGSCDTSCRIWDTRTNKCVGLFAEETMGDGFCHEADISSVQWMPSGDSFVSGSDDSTCQLYDLKAYNRLNKFHDSGMSCGVTGVDVSRSGRIVFAGYDNRSCIGWDALTTSKPMSLDECHDDRVSCIGVHPSGYALCTGSWDRTLKTWA